MTTRSLLDPELQGLPDIMPAFEIKPETLPGLREAMQQMVVMGDAEAAGVERREIHTESADGHSVRALVYSPVERTGTTAGYLHVHGGGYLMGSVESSDQMNVMLVRELGIVIVSLDYRLAPEHPIPAPLDDCYAGLAWLHQQAGALDVDPARIGVGGESAGGGLAAALAIKARDEGEYAVCHQHLTYPMLDDRTGSAEHPGDPLVGEFVWTRQSNQLGWRSYLGDAPAAAPQVPARLEQLEGLPPAWIFTAGLDLFRDENVLYAQRLLQAGIAAELLLYPRACHGFQMVPDSQIGARFVRDHREALARGLGVS